MESKISFWLRIAIAIIIVISTVASFAIFGILASEIETTVRIMIDSEILQVDGEIISIRENGRQSEIEVETGMAGTLKYIGPLRNNLSIGDTVLASFYFSHGEILDVAGIQKQQKEDVDVNDRNAASQAHFVRGGSDAQKGIDYRLPQR